MIVEKGQKYQKEFRFSFHQIEQFARVTGDSNPIHLDKQYAEACGFKNTIAHGFLTGSIISKIVGTEFPGEGTVYLSQNMSFKAPVFPEEKLIAELEVLDVKPSGKCTLKTTIYAKEHNEVKLTGEAVVLIRKRHSSQ